VSARIRIGLSGWKYPHWRRVFYPRGLAQRRELEFASHTFDALEINGSFYSLQRPSSFVRWRDTAPDGFTFAVKAARPPSPWPSLTARIKVHSADEMGDLRHSRPKTATFVRAHHFDPRREGARERPPAGDRGPSRETIRCCGFQTRHAD